MTDWRILDLSPGRRSLIEASAGTGKTWTISVLYLRLLLEEKMTPRQIMVATFTDAGAQELSARLRMRLQNAIRRADGLMPEEAEGSGSDEAWLEERWSSGEHKSVDRQRLAQALAEIDLAPIGTLHGLCQRILSDHPFAAGTLLKAAELCTDSVLKAEVAQDFYRRLTQTDPEAGDMDFMAALASDIGITRDSIRSTLSKVLMPGSRVPCLSGEEIRALLPEEWADRLCRLAEQDLYNQTCTLRDNWLKLAAIIKHDFMAQPKFRMPNRTFDNVLSRAEALTGVKAAARSNQDLIEAARFSVAVAESGILDDLREHAKCFFWKKAAGWGQEQINIRLAARNQRSFDALLSDVHAALQGDGGRALADTLHAAWPVALVDEFQDTDGIQYGILDAIYRNENKQVRGHLAMIGDPKQAIYRFRGGDIRAYERAASEAHPENKLVLGTNQRSTTHYVNAMNAWYGLCGHTLSSDDAHGIRYQRVDASGRHDGKAYAIDGESCLNPLVFHWDSNDEIPGGRRVGEALACCVLQIADMLASDRHTLSGSPVKPSDVAVLLPTNGHVAKLQRLLRIAGVPCVSMSRSSVFDTDTARELQIILYAVYHSDNAGALRAALGTRLIGETYHSLLDMMATDASWRKHAADFHRWRDMWLRRGIQSVTNDLAFSISGRQLAGLSGERNMTDLRHLGELLQAEAESGAGPEALLAWMAAQRASPDDAGEDAADSRQLRIESEGARVRLMTVHASKGLEFPIVFLPLMWAHGQRSESGPFQVGVDEEGMRHWRFGDAAKADALQELQDERFRVLYVALTRAIHACHVYVLSPRRPAAEGGNPDQGTARSALDVSMARLFENQDWLNRVKATPHIDWRDGWPARVNAGSQAGRLAVNGDGTDVERKCRILPPIPRGPLPSRHSFTTLLRGSERVSREESSAADEDVDSEAIAGISALSADVPPCADLADLMPVAGKGFGNAVHAVFEHRDLSKKLPEQIGLITRALAENNVRVFPYTGPEQIAGLLAARLQTVLETPLSPQGPVLGGLEAADLRAEMEFNYALTDAGMAVLRAACAAHGEPDLVPAQSRRLAGLMNGKIDLVFRHGGRYHVLDYKSNRLGPRVSDYAPEVLQAVMDGHHYRFQALLYVVALDRYLAQHIPGYDRARHLGDCYYLFVRAVGLGDTAGIWRHRFRDGMLSDVQHALAGAVGEGGA